MWDNLRLNLIFTSAFAHDFVESFFKSKDLFSWKRFLQKLRIILDNAIFSLFYGNIFLWYYTPYFFNILFFISLIVLGGRSRRVA